jgi:Protein of unknown function (DUF1761)
VDTHINYLAVLVAAVAYFMIGAVWYMVLFGTIWSKLMGFDKLGKKEEKAMKEKMGMSMAVNLVACLLAAYCMAFSVQSGAAFYHVAGIMLGIQTGFWIWLGFIATSQINSVIWDGRPVKLYLINVGYYLVSYVVVATILAVWQ